MRIIKLFGWIVLVLAIGLAGTVAIIVTANFLIDSQTKVKLPSGPFVSTDDWERGYVFAEGTFTIDNARSAHPLQITKIQCYRAEKLCTAARAEIAFGDMLYVDLSMHKISLWNDTTILFHENARCVEYVYTVDRANKRVIGTRTKKPNVSGCEMSEDRPLTLSLVNGFDVWSRLNQEAVARVSPFMWAGIAVWWVLLLFFGWRLRPRVPHLATT